MKGVTEISKLLANIVELANFVEQTEVLEADGSGPPDFILLHLVTHRLLGNAERPGGAALIPAMVLQGPQQQRRLGLRHSLRERPVLRENGAMVPRREE